MQLSTTTSCASSVRVCARPRLLPLAGAHASLLPRAAGRRCLAVVRSKPSSYLFQVANDGDDNISFQTEQTMLARYSELLRESNLMNELKSRRRFERPRDKAQRRRMERIELRKWERRQPGFVPESLESAGGGEWVLSEPFGDVFALRAPWDTVRDADEPTREQEEQAALDAQQGRYVGSPNGVRDLSAHMDSDEDVTAGYLAGAAAGSYASPAAAGFLDLAAFSGPGASSAQPWWQLQPALQDWGAPLGGLQQQEQQLAAAEQAALAADDSFSSEPDLLWEQQQQAQQAQQQAWGAGAGVVPLPGDQQQSNIVPVADWASAATGGTAVPLGEELGAPGLGAFASPGTGGFGSLPLGDVGLLDLGQAGTMDWLQAYEQQQQPQPAALGEADGAPGGARVPAAADQQLEQQLEQQQPQLASAGQVAAPPAAAATAAALAEAQAMLAANKARLAELDALLAARGLPTTAMAAAGVGGTTNGAAANGGGANGKVASGKPRGMRAAASGARSAASRASSGAGEPLEGEAASAGPAPASRRRSRRHTTSSAAPAPAQQSARQQQGSPARR